MLGLITNRTQANVDRLNELNAKGWVNMSPEEQAEWVGDPMAAPGGVNLMPNGPYYSGSVDLIYRNEYIQAVATQPGIYLYAVSIIGKASDFEGKTITVSVGEMSAVGGTPQLLLCWHDSTGNGPAGLALTGSNQSDTITLDTNQDNLEYLALYVYVTTDKEVSTGAVATYRHVMVEMGDTRHDYVPYTPILATPATLGAYNYSDLNRVETVVAELSEQLGLGLTTKTDWAMWDVPTAEDMSRYRDNLVAIEQHLKMEDTMGDIPSELSLLTYSHANQIELFLMSASSK